MWGYLGALVIAVIGKVFRATGENRFWITAALAVLIWTAYGQGLAASAYNGLVSGMFYNFFFSSQSGQLSFDSSGDWWLESAFVVVAILAGLLGRWVSKTVSAHPQRESTPELRDQDSDLVWDPQRLSDQSGWKKEKTWTW